MTQESNPVPVLNSILKLELSNTGFQKVSENTNEVKYVSKYKKKYTYGITKEFMKENGWKFKEQMGSGLAFVKNEKTITIETRQFSKNYYLWQVPTEALQ